MPVSLLVLNVWIRHIEVFSEQSTGQCRADIPHAPLCQFRCWWIRFGISSEHMLTHFAFLMATSATLVWWLSCFFSFQAVQKEISWLANITHFPDKLALVSSHHLDPKDLWKIPAGCHRSSWSLQSQQSSQGAIAVDESCGAFVAGKSILTEMKHQPFALHEFYATFRTSFFSCLICEIEKAPTPWD